LSAFAINPESQAYAWLLFFLQQAGTSSSTMDLNFHFYGASFQKHSPERSHGD
jgi:hypothetical protein